MRDNSSRGSVNGGSGKIAVQGGAGNNKDIGTGRAREKPKRKTCLNRKTRDFCADCHRNRSNGYDKNYILVLSRLFGMSLDPRALRALGTLQ